MSRKCPQCGSKLRRVHGKRQNGMRPVTLECPNCGNSVREDAPPPVLLHATTVPGTQLPLQLEGR